MKLQSLRDILTLMVALIHCVSGAPTARNVTSIQHGERFQPRRGLKTTRTLLRRATPSDTPGAGKAWDYGQPDLWKVNARRHSTYSSLS